MAMELNEIAAFLTISQVGGFTRAALLLSLSQPAISRRIELLERELGAPLFERLPTGARLTEAGQAFLPYARQILAAIDDGAAAVRALAQEDQGSVTLAMVGTLATTRLTQRFQEFRGAYPLVHLRLRTARSSEVSDLVLQGDANLGLRYFADPRPEILGSLPAMDEPMQIVAATRSRLIPGTPTEPIELRGIPWIGFPSGQGSSGEPFTRLLTQQLLRSGLGEAELIPVDSLTAQKRLIEADFGVGFLPATSLEEELRLETLRVLHIEALQTTVPVMLIYRCHGYLSRAARLLHDMLKAQPME